ncbi:MAG: hypothetical protein N3C13_03365, partial [Aquificaceae bacterium]|nr:hypothetical protein [Aquificaceae bacterium]
PSSLFSCQDDKGLSPAPHSLSRLLIIAKVIAPVKGFLALSGSFNKGLRKPLTRRAIIIVKNFPAVKGSNGRMLKISPKQERQGL